MGFDRDLTREYESRCAILRDLGPVVERLISELLRSAEINVHSVDHRVKDKTSLQRKLSNKDASYDGLEEVHDLLGLRIITLFPDEVDRVAAVIESEFTIDEENSVDKRALLDPDRFGYLSRHYVATLDDDRSLLTEHRRFEGIGFEIQIRSILQHVWAEIEHDLGYHNAGAIPNSVRRRFSRLAGLLEIADDEFQTLRNEISEYQSGVDEGIDKAPESVQIDQDSIKALLRHSERLRSLDEHVALSLNSSLDEEILYAAGSLALQLQFVGVQSVAEIDALLAAKDAHIRAFVDLWAARVGTVKSRLYPGISLFYLCYVLAAQSGSVAQIGEYLTAAEISLDLGETPESVAQEVLEVDAAAREAVGG